MSETLNRKRQAVLAAENQVKANHTVPEGLTALLENMSRQVILHNPKDIHAFLATYLEGLLALRDGHLPCYNGDMQGVQDGTAFLQDKLGSEMKAQSQPQYELQYSEGPKEVARASQLAPVGPQFAGSGMPTECVSGPDAQKYYAEYLKGATGSGAGPGTYTPAPATGTQSLPFTGSAVGAGGYPPSSQPQLLPGTGTGNVQPQQQYESQSSGGPKEVGRPSQLEDMHPPSASAPMGQQVTGAGMPVECVVGPDAQKYYAEYLKGVNVNGARADPGTYTPDTQPGQPLPFTGTGAGPGGYPPVVPPQPSPDAGTGNAQPLFEHGGGPTSQAMRQSAGNGIPPYQETANGEEPSPCQPPASPDSANQQPVGDQPANSLPISGPSATNQPKISQAPTPVSEPLASQAYANNQLASDQAANILPTANQPYLSQSAAIQSPTGQASATYSQPASDQPAKVKSLPVTNQPNLSQPVVVSPLQLQPPASQVSANHQQAGRGSDQPAESLPVANQPGSNQPSLSQPPAPAGDIGATGVWRTTLMIGQGQPEAGGAAAAANVQGQAGGDFTGAVREFVLNRVESMRQVFSSEVPLQEARNHVLTLAVSSFVGLVLAYALVRSLGIIGGLESPGRRSSGAGSMLFGGGSGLANRLEIVDILGERGRRAPELALGQCPK